jgi:hypothetical protein
MATILPVDYSNWARAAAGVATFLIAVSRALDFGSRWRWHLDMKARYFALLDKIEQVSLLPADQQQAALIGIYEALAEARSLERTIPGSGTPANPGEGSLPPVVPGASTHAP